METILLPYFSCLHFKKLIFLTTLSVKIDKGQKVRYCFNYSKGLTHLLLFVYFKSWNSKSSFLDQNPK